MSDEMILKSLIDFGIKQEDATVYLFLFRKGPKKAREITQTLSLNINGVYRVLRSLRQKGIVKASLEHPAIFSALPLESVLELFAQAKIEQSLALQKNREKILSSWRSMTNTNSTGDL